MYAGVAIDTGSTSNIDILTYEIPDDLVDKVSVGSSVLVPLGPRQAVGYVLEISSDKKFEKVRPLIAELDSPVRIDSGILDIARWISNRYLCPLPRVIFAMLPGILHCRVKSHVIEEAEAKGGARKEWSLVLPNAKPRYLKGVKLADAGQSDVGLTSRRAEVREHVASHPRGIAVSELKRSLKISDSVISSLVASGHFEWTEIRVRRAPGFHRVDMPEVLLSDEQQLAVDTICGAVDAGEYAGHLMHGVTASGKTEVYLRSIEHTLKAGRSCLILLPEIALTTQVMNLFRSRLGERVAVLHSGLSDGERCDEWLRIQDGEADVVLGARSAIFAPMKKLGLVIVDEEHESSYKQDTQPRYHGREVAAYRAWRENAVLVLGSATPSVESYYKAEAGEYKLIKMTKRVENRPMPEVMVADLRQEWAQGKATIFSSSLEDAVRERLARNEQVVLLQNRRAYSTFLLCRDCGLVMRCPNCAVSLKFHSGDRKLSCHHCDHTEPAPSVCPSCRGTRLKGFGIGTERVEEETKRIFPEARVVRMDRDTTARKGSHGEILKTFRERDADILVGTQMIAKGLDFPSVTLAGVISADTSINLPDFRASERTFQLISQVSGRSGRGKVAGEVILQTFDPDHSAIRFAVNHDYEGYYRQEIEYRKELSYPPFASIIYIVSHDPESQKARTKLEGLVKEIKSMPLDLRAGIVIHGPSPAVLEKLRGEYRYHIVLKSKDRESMLHLMRAVFDNKPALKRGLGVDVDPESML